MPVRVCVCLAVVKERSLSPPLLRPVSLGRWSQRSSSRSRSRSADRPRQRYASPSPQKKAEAFAEESKKKTSSEAAGPPRREGISSVSAALSRKAQRGNASSVFLPLNKVEVLAQEAQEAAATAKHSLPAWREKFLRRRAEEAS